jgi:hypothetical protein
MGKLICRRCQEEKEWTSEFFPCNYHKTYKKFYLEKVCKKCRYKRNEELRKERYHSDPEFRKRVLIRSEKSRQKSQAKRDEVYWKRRERQKLWVQNNPEKVKEGYRIRNAKRWKDSRYKTSKSVSNYVNKLIKDKDNYHTFDILGYSLQDLMNHLESQFVEGMSWENHGEWHIDHIKPVCSFNFNSREDEDFKKCWALENLRPLWAKENLKKSAEDKKLKSQN